MAAYTVEDAAKLQAEELKLVHQKLCSLPAGMGTLTACTVLLYWQC
jgi:hypothetical protein